MSKSCSLFFFEGYLDSAPTILSFLRALNECGYAVTVYTNKHRSSNPIDFSDSTKVISFVPPSEVPLLLLLRELMLKIKLGSFLPLVDLLVFCVQFFSYLLVRAFNDREFCFSNTEEINFGVDRLGSILALIKAHLFGQKLIYLSLELIDPRTIGKLTAITGIVTSLERLAYRTSECVLIQDEDRFRVLSKYNQHHHPTVFYLPNSPYSSSPSLQAAELGSNHFRETFPLDKKSYSCIVLHAGMINESVCLKSIAYAFSSINKNYALVFNSSTTMSFNDPYIEALREINQENLFLSLKPLPYKEIHKIYESATIGLAFYEQVDDNFSLISKASGKLAFFLKYGKPVLVSDLESLSNLVETYEIGIVIRNSSDSVEIEIAIERILNDYDRYSRNARFCFEQEFDFGKKVKPVLSFIQAL